MDSKTEKQIIAASAKLIAKSGIEEFSIEKLSNQPEMKRFDVYTLIENEEKIFTQLLLELEKDLKELIGNISFAYKDPEQEFENLFKQLYKFFKQKPHNLILIFEKFLQYQYRSANKILVRIKNIAKDYLTELIDRGKAQKVFTIEVETEELVTDILGSFQSLMNDMQMTGKMLRDLKKYQSSNE